MQVHVSDNNVRIDVTGAEALRIRPHLYMTTEMMAWGERVVEAMGFHVDADHVLNPWVHLKRGVYNRGFAVTVWTKR